METAQLDPQETLPQTDAGPVLAPPRQKKKWLKWLFLALAVLLAAWWFLLRPRGSAPLPTGQYLPAPAAVRDRFTALGDEMKMQVTMTRQEVFDAMHTI